MENRAAENSDGKTSPTAKRGACGARSAPRARPFLHDRAPGGGWRGDPPGAFRRDSGAPLPARRRAGGFSGADRGGVSGRPGSAGVCQFPGRARGNHSGGAGRETRGGFSVHPPGRRLFQPRGFSAQRPGGFSSPGGAPGFGFGSSGRAAARGVFVAAPSVFSGAR